MGQDCVVSSDLSNQELNSWRSWVLCYGILCLIFFFLNPCCISLSLPFSSVPIEGIHLFVTRWSCYCKSDAIY